MVIRIGSGHRSPTGAGRGKPGRPRAIRTVQIAQIHLSQLLGRLPDVRVTIDNHNASSTGNEFTESQLKGKVGGN
jgi:hypothetical protein